MILKQKEMFNELVDERIKDILKLNEKVDYDDLIYRYKGNTSDEKFNTYDNAFSFLDNITLTNAETNQKKFRLDLNCFKDYR